MGHVPAGLELSREVRGNRDDPPIPNAAETVHLKEDEHFHSGPPREITIIVNGSLNDHSNAARYDQSSLKHQPLCRSFGTLITRPSSAVSSSSVLWGN